LQDEVVLSASHVPPLYSAQTHSTSNLEDHHHVFFKSGRMYKHQLLRINYTSYDVRRSQDIINLGTLRRDIMTLANDSHDDSHPFRYGRVLGIYHVNVVYRGSGAIDYVARRLDFLWVRWFEYKTIKPMVWADYQLDQVYFPQMSRDDAFGFVDPKDVLRACHMVPNFPSGKVHDDAVSVSKLANDAHDWQVYYVNRYVRKLHHPFLPVNSVCRFPDRDMLMRFHWGLAVGHAYTHDSTLTEDVVGSEDFSDDVSEPDTEESGQHLQTDLAGFDLSEFSLGDRENHNWDYSDDDEAVSECFSDTEA
jgi:hypothetical protein